jgi:hypothetical protein
MSDYDAVLELLLTDPTFSRRLAADPERELAGYALTDDERRTLTAGISADAGRTSTVEPRMTKAGLVGVAGLVAELAGSIVEPPPGDATLVAFTQGAVHEPVVVGQLYDDEHAAPPPDADNRLLTTIAMPAPDHPAVENPPPHGQGQDQGHGHSDKADPAHPEHHEDAPPSRS